MEVIKIIVDCFRSSSEPEDPRHEGGAKAQVRTPGKANSPVRSAEEISAEVIELLRNAEKNGPALRRRVGDVVGEEGWTENIARAVLARLEPLLKESREKLGPALAEAIQKAEEAALAVFTFSKNHPYLVAGFVTIVAVGVLVLMAPWVVEALGFGELGPVADSFAAWWQSTYAGYVPEGSLFSFFQRLGMIWARS